MTAKISSRQAFRIYEMASRPKLKGQRPLRFGLVCALVLVGATFPSARFRVVAFQRSCWLPRNLASSLLTTSSTNRGFFRGRWNLETAEPARPTLFLFSSAGVPQFQTDISRHDSARSPLLSDACITLACGTPFLTSIPSMWLHMSSILVTKLSNLSRRVDSKFASANYRANRQVIWPVTSHTLILYYSKIRNSRASVVQVKD